MFVACLFMKSLKLSKKRGENNGNKHLVTIVEFIVSL